MPPSVGRSTVIHFVLCIFSLCLAAPLATASATTNPFRPYASIVEHDELRGYTSWSPGGVWTLPYRALRSWIRATSSQLASTVLSPMLLPFEKPKATSQGCCIKQKVDTMGSGASKPLFSSYLSPKSPFSQTHIPRTSPQLRPQSFSSPQSPKLRPHTHTARRTKPVHSSDHSAFLKRHRLLQQQRR